MNEFDEVHRLLVKDYSNGEQRYMIISGDEELITGPLSKVAQYIKDHELFDICADENSGKHLASWRYATEDEISVCLNEAKYLYSFEESDN